MKTYWAILLLLVLCGCASGEYGKLITPDQVTWIQKGGTTRDEIIARFGAPQMPEVQDLAGMQNMEFESTSVETVEEGKKVTRTKMKPMPQPHQTIAQYFFTRSEAIAFAGATTTSKNFWVCYDEAGVVQSSGFSEMPITSCPAASKK